MRAATEQNYRESRHTFGLLTGLLLPPIAWGVQMSISYAVVRFECYGGSKRPLYLIAIVALILTALGGLISLVNRRKVDKGRDHDFDGEITRSRFLAVLGMLSSGMFFVVIFAQGLATLVLHPCLL